MELIEMTYEQILAALNIQHWSALSHIALYRTVLAVVCVLLMWLAFIFCKRILTPLVAKVVERTQANWDDLLFNDKVMNVTCHLVPPVILYIMIPVFFYPLSDKPMPSGDVQMENLCYALVKIYMVVVAVRWCFVFLSSVRMITDTATDHRNGYLLGVIQLFKIIAGFVGFILIVSILMNKSPLALFAGLGAAATILMLVFKDAILGFVAGIQLAANDMLRKGDWITVPQSGADGTVEEISLSTVKVRNFDKTVTTIPPYTLISQSFQNWRGMETSGGRRVRRSFLFDMNSIRLCTAEERLQIKKLGLILPEDFEDEDCVNLNLFCKAIEAFLIKSPEVNEEMSLVVRLQPATAQGLPVEVYFFLRNKKWTVYEHNQNLLLSQIIALVPVFGLRLYQAPSGSDLLAFRHAE